MKLSLSKLPIVCINLEYRKDRKAHIEAELQKEGLQAMFFQATDKTLFKVPEISPKAHESNAAGILGCAMSHIAVIEYAKKQKWPAVCVIEDDIIFCHDFRNRLKYVEGLKDFDFDIFCLGGHFSNKEIQGEEAERTQWQDVCRIKKMNGTYGLIFIEKTYDFILRNWHYGLGADQLYSDHVYSRFNTYALVPFLVGCGKNKSDVTGQEWEYENIKWHFNKVPDSRLISETEAEAAAAKPTGLSFFPSNTDGFVDLQDCTFIIPVKIESKDREFNFIRCVQHLCNTVKTNIIIKECHDFSAVLELMNKIDKKYCKITTLFEYNNNGIFHRTRLLNEMLAMVKTPVVINYDCDILLKPETYFEARDKIINDGFDLVYPYGREEDQVQVSFPDKQNYIADLFNTRFHSQWGSLCGHVQFFKTKSYREGFMENEGFVAYAPEDRERMERFTKLGYNVCWLPGHKVFHIEHSRGQNSSVQNPFYGPGEALYNRLVTMDKEQLLAYYGGQDYLQKYATATISS